MRLYEFTNDDVLSEINWKKGIATAATIGALATGSGQARAYDYYNSPLHKDFVTLSNKLDQYNSNVSQANKNAAQAKGLAIGSVISGGLASLGAAWQNSEFKDEAEKIATSGPYKIFQSKIPGGGYTVVAGKDRAVILSDTSNLGMAGTVWTKKLAEVSPGQYEGGRFKFNSSTGILSGNPVIGDEWKKQLKLVDSSTDGQSLPPPPQTSEIKDLSKDIIKFIGTSLRSQIEVNPKTDNFQHSAILIYFDENDNITKVELEKSTGDSELDKQLINQVEKIGKVPGARDLKALNPKLQRIGLRTQGIKGMDVTRVDL